MIYTLKVVEIRRETVDTVTLCFKQPSLRKIKYKSGQYLSLIFRINNRRYVRPYSLSSCPETDQFLEVTVKRVENGIISNHIIDQVKQNDSIEVMPPMGNFIFDPESTFDTVYLWGVGSGITPLISIAKHILTTKPLVKVHLIYGNKTVETTIFADKIKALELHYNERFFSVYFYTRLEIESNKLNLVKGRIDKSKVEDIINKSNNLSNSCHFICGPRGLKELIKSTLLFKGLDNENIFYEDFESVKDPKDFVDVKTEKVCLNFKNEDYIIEVTKGKSVLEAALDSNIELPYSCQTGSCNSCVGNLIHGKAKMLGVIDDRRDLTVNEYLLCCTYPLNEHVKIII